MTVPFLEVADASFHYGRRHVLDHVALSVGRGEIYVLLGPNGAGKSTLVRAITGQIHLDNGQVLVGGARPEIDASARRSIGVVPQNIALYEKLNARENLNVIGRLMGVAASGMQERITEMLDRIALGDRARDRVEVLSGGMRRRLNIGAALMHEPSLLILDEPTVGVDQAGRHAVRELLIALRDGGLAVLLTTHEMDEADALADRVGVIVEGRLKAEGTPGHLVAEQFGQTLELIVQLADPSVPQSKVHKVLSSLNLSYDPSTGQWRGLVMESEVSMQVAVNRIMHAGFSVKDIRMRRPGLDTLLAHLTAQRDLQ